MGRAKQTKRFATMKRMISASDPRLKVMVINGSKRDYVSFFGPNVM